MSLGQPSTRSGQPSAGLGTLVASLWGFSSSRDWCIHTKMPATKRCLPPAAKPELDLSFSSSFSLSQYFGVEGRYLNWPAQHEFSGQRKRHPLKHHPLHFGNAMTQPISVPAPVTQAALLPFVLLALFLLLLSGCAASQSQLQPEIEEPQPIEEEEAPPHPHAAIAKPEPGEEFVQSDLNGDGKPDTFKYYLPRQDKPEELRLVRREMDLNFDGRLDLWNWYGEEGELVKQAFDLDFDGKIDVVSFFEHGVVVRKELYQRSGDKPDAFKYYSNGQLIRSERDTTGNGKIDTWEYWEEGRVHRVGQDLDGDGKVDRWTTPDKVRR